MRDITSVINKMLNEIPAEEVGLIASLQSIISSVSFCAPENIGMWWSELHHVVNSHLPTPAECSPWQMQVGLIYMDKA